MARVEITTSELIDALRAASGSGDVGPSDAYTRNEIKAATGWGMPRISGHLHELKKAGLVEIVAVKRARLDDRIASVPGYRFLKKAKR